jgi:Rab GDP dissociation inhibitor
MYVAMVSTIVETSTPERELEAGLKLLGPIADKWVHACCQRHLLASQLTAGTFVSFRFVSISPIYAPASSGTRDNVYVTRSYDATSHFETVTDDVKDVWRRCMKQELELKKRESELEAAA